MFYRDSPNWESQAVFTLSFTLEFLRPHVPTSNFYILMEMSDDDYETSRGSFRFKRVPVLQQLTMTVSWK